MGEGGGERRGREGEKGCNASLLLRLSRFNFDRLVTMHDE